MKSNGWLACVLACGLGLALVACDGSKKGNNNNVETCGDGVRGLAEECDGADLGGATCETIGMTGSGLACQDNCTFDRSACTGCGNGQIELGEVCDGDNLDGQTCVSRGFLGGTLTCAADCTGYDTSACEEITTVCAADDVISLDRGQVVAMHVDTYSDDDTVNVSCEDGPGTPDHLVAITLEATSDLVVTYPSDWLVFALFNEPSSPADCYTGANEISCLDPYEVGSWLVWPNLAAGTYYLAISDWSTDMSQEIDYYISAYAPGGEICDNGIDDDGDGDVDCADSDCDTSGFCAEEICDNGVDDNYNGMTDCLDYQCVGQTACTGGGCTADTDLGVITSVQTYEVAFNTAGASDSYTLPCGSPAAGDHVVAFTLAHDSNVTVEFTQSAAGANTIGFFFEGGPGSTCIDQEYFCFTPSAASVAGYLTDRPLPPGNYYFIVEAAPTGGQVTMSFSVTLVCPSGQHDEGGTCVWDTCADLDCVAVNMDCNDTPTPSVCEGCLAGYASAYGRCILENTGYGDPCEKNADCPGTQTADSFIGCTTSTGGYCFAVDVPECVTPGDPCTGDPNSICVLDPTEGDRYCLKNCTDNTGCRPGYQCEAGIFGSDQSACNIINQCDVDGCNDTTGDYYCDSANPSDTERLCWLDACDPNPCITLPNSTGECTNSVEDYLCVCDSGYLWTAGSSTCELFVCDAEDLGAFTGTTISREVNSCTDDSAWSYSPATIDCTGYNALGQEVVFSLDVTSGQAIRVTMTPTGGNSQDSVLYLIGTCDDFDAATCLAGVDATLNGEPETLTYTPTTDGTIYIVADAYSGCGTLTVTVQTP